jgi:hypothetical protein
VDKYEVQLEERNWQSAKGAEYESQGQVRAQQSTTPLGLIRKHVPALKVRNKNAINDACFALSELVEIGSSPRGDALRFAQCLPWL